MSLIGTLRPLLHPMLVHFPIALLFASVALDWLGYFLGHLNLTRAGFYLLVLGAAGAGVSALTGPDHATGDASVANLLVLHQSFALLTVALAVGLFLVRFFAAEGIGGRWAWLYLGISLALLAALSLTGYFGGELTYHHAVGVTTFAGQSAAQGSAEGRPLVPVKPMVALIGMLTIALIGAWLIAGKSLAAEYYAQWRSALSSELGAGKGRLWTLWREQSARIAPRQQQWSAQPSGMHEHVFRGTGVQAGAQGSVIEEQAHGDRRGETGVPR